MLCTFYPPRRFWAISADAPSCCMGLQLRCRQFRTTQQEFLLQLSVCWHCGRWNKLTTKSTFDRRNTPRDNAEQSGTATCPMRRIIVQKSLVCHMAAISMRCCHIFMLVVRCSKHVIYQHVRACIMEPEPAEQRQALPLGAATLYATLLYCSLCFFLTTSSGTSSLIILSSYGWVRI